MLSLVVLIVYIIMWHIILYLNCDLFIDNAVLIFFFKGEAVLGNFIHLIIEHVSNPYENLRKDIVVGTYAWLLLCF